MALDGSKLRGAVTWSDRESILDTIDEVSTSMRSILGASCGYSRRMFEIFGPVQVDTAYTDMIWYFRARLAGRVQHIPDTLVRYREGGISRGEADIAWKIKRRQIEQAVYRQRRIDLSTLAKRVDGQLAQAIRESRQREARLKRRAERQRAVE